MARNFRNLIEVQWSAGNFVCVGLDSDFDAIPHSARVGTRYKPNVMPTITAFNRAIVEATHDLVCAYKLNPAFYAKYGPLGSMALRSTIRDIFRVAPRVPVILDGKRGDIVISNESYVIENFGIFEADACTVNPYFGGKSLKSFLDRKEKGVFVVCRTSNEGAEEFQDLTVGGENLPLYRTVARRVAWDWNTNDNCGLVMGATHPYQLATVRRDVNGMPILIPGIGAQDGDLAAIARAGGRNIIVNSSRGVIFASQGTDFAAAARSEVERLHAVISESPRFFEDA